MATGTKLMKEINDQFLICKICFEPYKDPKTLICLHTFCCDCVQKHTEAENSRPSRYNLYSRYVTCPLCRKKTEIPSGGIRNLQDNFLVSSLTEVINKRTCTKIPPCEICHTIRPRSNEACSKCLECNKFLCAGCVELHMTTKVTQKHSLIDIEGEKDIECKAHPEEIVRFYCEPCDACICVVCTFQEHRDHEICSFNDGFTKYKETLVDLLDRCKERLGGVASRVKLIDKYELLMKEIRERIRDIAIDYMTQVRARERELIKKVDDLFGSDVLEFIQNKSWLQENLDHLQSTCNLTEIIMKDKGVEMMLLKRELQAKFAHLLDSQLPQVPDNLPEDVRFIPGDVRLGYLSVNGEHEGPKSIKDSIYSSEGVTQSTQTTIKEYSVGTSSMAADMKIMQTCCEMQTEPLTMCTKQTSTLVKETRDRGVTVFTMESKTKGTMTPSLDVRSLKSQTDKVPMYDQTSMTSIPSIPPPQSMGDNWSQSSSNVTNSACDTNSSYNRQNRWIRSRKIQTDISAIDNTEDDKSFRNGTLMTGDDMVNGHAEVNNTSASMARRDYNNISRLRSTSAPTMTDKETSPDKILQKDQSVMVSPISVAIETQTPITKTKNSSVATDYEGQQHKGVCTVKVPLVNCATGTPHVTSESKVTWTEKMMTTERATCTVNPTLNERSTATQAVEYGDYGVQVRPRQRTVATNMRPRRLATRESQTDLPVNENVVSNGVTEPAKVNGVKDVHYESICVGTENMDVWTKSMDRLSFHCMESSTETLDVRLCDKETGTNQIQYTDKWTLTNKPQFIDTGVSPPTPATFDAGVSTNAVITMEQATYTDVKTYKEMGVATVVVLAESETMTEKIQTSEAQTCVEIQTEESETSTDKVEMMDEMTMAELCTCKEDTQTYSKETQCGKTKLGEGTLVNSSLDDSFNNSYSDILECVRCENLLHDEKQYIDSGTMPQKYETQEVGTMALSIYGNSPDVVDVDTQTSEITTSDKSVTAAFEHEEVPKNLLHYTDAATSTESLPYIGLLSEIDVDDLIVFPEAQFDLVSDYSSSEDDVEMVDDETSTDWLDGIETGTQTFQPSGTSTPVTDDLPQLFRNVGVNTHQKLTFEKETCTPIRHLFSKGTMTFYVSRTDKATSTINQSRYLAESAKFGGRVGRESNKYLVSDKDTMTNKAEQRDASVETDQTLLDGKISECITKLRSVSDRLNSPTMRQSSDSDVFFDKSFLYKRGSDSSELTSSLILTDSSSSLREGKLSPGSPSEKSEEERQKHLQQLLAETQTTRKPKDNKAVSKKDTALNAKQSKRSSSGSAERHLTSKPQVPEKPDSLKPGSNSQTAVNPTPIKSILKTSSSSQASKCVGPRETVSSPATPVIKPRRTLSKTPDKTIDTDPLLLESRLKELDNELDISQAKSEVDPNTTPVQMRKKIDVPKRKPQPITTLKGKKAEDDNTYKTRSLPRQFSTENSPLSALIIQTSPPSRLPLLRYNSAPGRIATVPTHTLLKKAGQSPPLRTSNQRQVSPSKIPISSRQCSPEQPMTDIYGGAQKTKAQQKPSLPAISETRTPSSCSDSSDVSFLSLTSGDSMSLSLTPSIGTVSSGTSEQVAGAIAPQPMEKPIDKPGTSTPATSKPKPKSEKAGFMQRLFSKKKKEAEQKPEIIHTTTKWTPPPKPPPEPPKIQIPNKTRPFVYVRSRIFSIQDDKEDEKKYLKEEEEKRREEEKRKEEEMKAKKEKEKKEDKKSKTKTKGKKPPSSPSLKPGKKTNRLSRETDSDLSDSQLGATSLGVPDSCKM
ncbi:mucin-17-like [Patella vulgata]|uniref:mucin-17-like n=1 Tax=Patella vulgata TaxID=6465 RepID=UPI0024A9C6C3|nr:mucin-17-like [Patella vulgata]